MKRLIIGLDPGATVGVAVYGLDGKQIATFSSKSIGLDEVLKRVREFGKPVIVGTDKAKVPQLVQEFAAKTGARVVAPNEDLRADEKLGFNGNNHEKDAQAMAEYAYKRSLPLLDKTRKTLAEKPTRDNEFVMEMVIKGMSRIAAIALLKNEKEEEINEIIEKKAQPRNVTRLYNEIAEMKEKNKMLQLRVKRLEDELAKKPQQKIVKHVDKSEINRIRTLENEIMRIKRVNDENADKIKNLKKVINAAEEYTFAEITKNLGQNELAKTKTKTIFVENPAEFSARTTELLKGAIVLHNSKIPKELENSETRFIKLEKTPEIIEEYALIEKKELETAIRKKAQLNRIITDYKRERSNQII